VTFIGYRVKGRPLGCGYIRSRDRASVLARDVINLLDAVPAEEQPERLANLLRDALAEAEQQAVADLTTDPDNRIQQLPLQRASRRQRSGIKHWSNYK
jgi:hypothetical protein